jgi:hypothetical protein
MRPVLALLVVCVPAFCQQQSTDPQLLAIFNGISQHAARLGTMLEQIHPADWVAKGAPETYTAQWNSAMQDNTGIQSEMAGLAQNPNRMSDSLNALFRIQAFHELLNSLMGGLRKYQNPALADLIESVAAEDHTDVDRLQQYILQMASDKEEQLTVMDREAQRCRATLSRQPANNATPNRRVQ